jgi:aquaporin Z
LGKIPVGLAALYICAQFAGGTVGVLVSLALLGPNLARPEVQYAATFPGAAGNLVVVLAEFVISFFLMFTVLHVSNNSRISRYTGIMAGLLVAVYVTFESPFSGMSMNPARTFASALPSGVWNGVWIYLVAPPLAMLVAAELYVRSGRLIKCCKLHHHTMDHCIFCGKNGESR